MGKASGWSFLTICTATEQVNPSFTSCRDHCNELLGFLASTLAAHSVIGPEARLTPTKRDSHHATHLLKSPQTLFISLRIKSAVHTTAWRPSMTWPMQWPPTSAPTAFPPCSLCFSYTELLVVPWPRRYIATLEPLHWLFPLPRLLFG